MLKQNKLALLTSFVVASSMLTAFARNAEADSPDDLLVVVNKQVPIDSVSMAEVRRFFMRKKTSWNHGQKVVPINPQDGSQAKRFFLERVLQMTSVEEKRYWENEKVRKGITPPVVFNNSLKAVFKLTGGISYVLRKNYIDGVVKVVLVIPDE